MPIDPISASMAIGASQSGINSLLTIGQNRATRKWNEKMYDRQRQDHLADWNMQNVYNSPAAQMERLRAAGLNPNLVYGKGADNTAMSINKSDVKTWDRKNVQLEGAPDGGIMNAMNIQLAQANKDNMEKQNSLLSLEALKKNAEIDAITQGTNKSKFELALEQELRQNSLDMRAQQLKNMGLEGSKIQADTAFTINAKMLATAKNASDLQEALARIVSMGVQNAKTEQERQNLMELKKSIEQDVRLKKSNINWSDPWIIRKAEEQITNGLKDFRKGGKYSSDRWINQPLKKAWKQLFD